MKILVVRRGGFEGNITVSYQILNETNATLGLDYKDGPGGRTVEHGWFTFLYPFREHLDRLIIDRF